MFSLVRDEDCTSYNLGEYPNVSSGFELSISDNESTSNDQSSDTNTDEEASITPATEILLGNTFSKKRSNSYTSRLEKRLKVRCNRLSAPTQEFTPIIYIGDQKEVIGYLREPYLIFLFQSQNTSIPALIGKSVECSLPMIK